MPQRVRRILAGLILGLLAAAGTRGQAWLPPAGEAGFSFAYGNFYSSHHYTPVPVPDQPNVVFSGAMRTQTLALILGYGITDRFALTASIPFITSKYRGLTPHKIGGVIVTPDDGQYHGTFQDYRINLGFQAVRGEVAVAPFVTAVIPSREYWTIAHSAPGRGQNQWLLGFAAGASLDRIVPQTFAEVYYDYAIVEKVLGFQPNRSDFGLQLGYFITPSLGVRFISVGFYSHSGLVTAPGVPLTQEQFLVHDQIAKMSNVSVGGGLSYQLTGNTDVGISYLRSVDGRRMTKLDHGLGFSVSYSFSPEQILRGLFPPKPDHAPGPLDK